MNGNIHDVTGVRLIRVSLNIFLYFF